MNDPPQLLRPVRHASGGQSPTRQRAQDDILAHTSPASAFGALSSPSYALGRCLAEASIAEREFAMRTAVASRSVWEWVEELSEWSWPSGGQSNGFDIRAGDDYLGSLTATEFAEHEQRIEEIRRGMASLDLEEIKNHVLTNYIMPLSRPTTPISETGLTCDISYNRMEDLTAVVTAIVVQTLPNLARLNRLLHVWSIRLCVLEQVPSLSSAMEDAELALKSGWAAIYLHSKSKDAAPSEPAETTLTRKDFGLMKAVIDSKVSAPGRTLDYMLDRLEGLADTLPDNWLDRMEMVERGYAEWMTACELKIREAEWAEASQSRKVLRQSPSREEASAASHEAKAQSKDDHISLPAPKPAEDFGEPSKAARDARKASRTLNEALAVDTNQLTPPSSSPTQETPEFRLHLDESPLDIDETCDDSLASRVRVPTPIKEEEWSLSPDQPRNRSIQQDDKSYMSDTPSPIDGDDEPELPHLLNEDRRGSDASHSSAALQGASLDSSFGLSSELPEVSASPDIPRTRIHEAEYVQSSPDDSPPSSPPLPETDLRESSVAPSGAPIEKSAFVDRDGSLPPQTPLDGSFSEYFDDSFSISEVASPSVRRESTGDQQLQQQIGEIIDKIPAKIKLSAEPPNLNPPDLQLPRLRKKPSREPVKRSVSAMSARTATPSFTLSPVKNSRTRHQRGQQEIKVYHLSRSTGEAPIKLFIRCVGDKGERVMVRVGGGWADLSEYLKEYATHHGRRSAGSDKAKVEIRDAPRSVSGCVLEPRSTPPSRPASALEASPMTPLAVRKARRSAGAVGSEAPRLRPKTPGTPLDSLQADDLMLSSEERTTRSRSSSHVSWVEEDSMGLAGPSGKKVEMSEENKAWVESVREKVRLASGERKPVGQDDYGKSKFGELGRVGGTKRVFRRSEGQQGQGQKGARR